MINNKQKKFIQEYIKDRNGTRAYKVAYPNCKDTTANVNANKLLRNASIQKEITKLLDKAEKKAVADLEEILQFYTKGMRGERKESVLALIGGGMQDEIKVSISEKDKIKCAENLAKLLGFDKQSINLNIEPIVITGGDTLED